MSSDEDLSPEEAEAIRADALALNDRYLREIVEGFNVCPYARGARVAGRTDRAVLLQTHLGVDPALDEIARYERGDDAIEIVQLIFARLAVGPAEFDEFVGRVRAARDAIAPKPPFALACFHPDFKANFASPDALVPFFRRAPHPMIQLVRFASLHAIHEGSTEMCPTPELIALLLRGEAMPRAISMTERIARDNFERAKGDGVTRFEAIYASIADDRARSRAR